MGIIEFLKNMFPKEEKPPVFKVRGRVKTSAKPPKKEKPVKPLKKAAVKKPAARTTVIKAPIKTQKARIPVKKTVKNESRKVLPGKNIQTPIKPGKKPEPETLREEIGVITHYFEKISVGVIKVKKELKVGDTVRIEGKSGYFLQKISSMQSDHKNIETAGKNADVGIKVIKPVHENDKVYKA